MEKWRRVPIKGYRKCYEVSNRGRVRSILRLARTKNGFRTVKGKVLKPVPNDGYLGVSLSYKNKIKRYQIHNLVLYAFRGPRPDGLVARHKDGNRTNNRLSNLVYGTYEENNQDTVRHGRRHNNKGTNNPNSKFSKDVVRTIRKRVWLGETQIAVALDYGVSSGTICNLVNGKSYKEE